jgi:hypothetical protein
MQFPDIWKVIPKDYPVPRYLEPQAQTYRTQAIPAFNPRGPDVDRLLSDMDEMGLDMRAMSIPFWRRNKWKKASRTWGCAVS